MRAEPVDDACMPLPQLSEHDQVAAMTAHTHRLRAAMQTEHRITVLSIPVNRSWPTHLLHPRWLPHPVQGSSNETTFAPDCLHYCVSGDGRTGWNRFVNFQWLGEALGIH